MIWNKTFPLLFFKLRIMHFYYCRYFELRTSWKLQIYHPNKLTMIRHLFHDSNIGGIVISIISTSLETIFKTRPTGVTLKKLIFACIIVLSILSCKTWETIKQPTYKVVVPNISVITVKLLVKYINQSKRK